MNNLFIFPSCLSVFLDLCCLSEVFREAFHCDKGAKVGFIFYALLKCVIRIIISMLKDLGRVVIHKVTRRQWEVYQNR